MKFFTGQRLKIIDNYTPIKCSPNIDSETMSEALYGENFILKKTFKNWLFGKLESDNYEGFISINSISTEDYKHTHYVSELRTYMYSKPDIKSVTTGILSINSLITVVDEVRGFSKLNNDSYVFTRHIDLKSKKNNNYIDTAIKFTNTPYKWGGRTSFGIDCSGLVQLSLMNSGYECPRDSELQKQVLGKNIPLETCFNNLKKGDLIFWEGHVGIMVSDKNIIHANSFSMDTRIEKLTDVDSRISQNSNKICEIKRILV